jgi:hypothetical protein
VSVFRETTNPTAFADLPLTPAYPRWGKPIPAAAPSKHRKMYTFLRGIMAGWDNIVAAAASAAYCHGSQTAPADALDLLGENYGGLARAIIDDNDSYRAYLKAPLTRWHRFGTRTGLLGELAHLGYPSAQIVSWRDLVDAGAGPENVVFGGHVNFFYVALFQPNRFSSAARARWKTTGSRWKTTGDRWGGGRLTQESPFNELRRVIQLVKPAHTSCRFIVCFLDSVSGLDAHLLPTGAFFTIPMNELWERIRPSYAYNPYYITSPLVP